MNKPKEEYKDYLIGNYNFNTITKEYRAAIKLYCSTLFKSRYNWGKFKIYYYEIPMEVLKKDILASIEPGLFQSFDDYHNYYVTIHGLKEHADIWPVFLDNTFGCVIEDGWQRFHSYVKQGLEIVPCLLIE